MYALVVIHVLNHMPTTDGAYLFRSEELCNQAKATFHDQKIFLQFRQTLKIPDEAKVWMGCTPAADMSTKDNGTEL